MIKVVFKLNKQNGYDTDAFTYADYVNAEVGDIVVAETRYGYAIAKVIEININDDRFDEDSLAQIKTIIESAAEQKYKQERINKQKNLITRMRRAKILDALTKMNFEDSDKKIINIMTDKELNKFYDDLLKYFN